MKVDGKAYAVISERTYKEWDDSHPGRKLPVMPNEYLELGDIVVCSIKGEPRIPAPRGDMDITAVCHKCGMAVIHRASAPKLPKECWKCFMARGTF